MSKAIVTILAQFEENKAWYDGGEAWKPKGGHKFVVEIDSDFLLYANKDALEMAFSKMMAEQSNDCERFTYIEHDVDFGGPSKLNAEYAVDLIKEAEQELEELEKYERMSEELIAQSTYNQLQ